MWWLHGKTKPYYFPRLFRNAKIVVLFFITVGCRRCVAIALSCNGRRRHTTQTNEMKNINVLLWTVVRLSTDRRSQRQCWWKYVTTLFHRCPSQAVRCIVSWWSPNGCGFSCYSVAASADEIVASNDMFVSTKWTVEIDPIDMLDARSFCANGSQVRLAYHGLRKPTLRYT